jgi:predicted pyridoxine 5'-phosphate oxidase superfamily flavin-nucleotide-binding protein
MPVPYQSEHRSLHDRFDTRRLADRVNERLTTDMIDETDGAFIESLDMFFIATVDRRGVPTCSYKGGDPGFVHVLNPHELAFPLYDGNGMFLTAGNMAACPSVGLLFIDFEHGRRLRIHGEAKLDEGLTWLFPGALLAVRVRVREVFQNCGRYVHRRTLIERSSSVPAPDGTTPPADWKCNAFAVTELPADDPANSRLYRARARVLTLAAALVGKRPGRYTR